MCVSYQLMQSLRNIWTSSEKPGPWMSVSRDSDCCPSPNMTAIFSVCSANGLFPVSISTTVAPTLLCGEMYRHHSIILRNFQMRISWFEAPIVEIEGKGILYSGKASGRISSLSTPCTSQSDHNK